MPPLQFTSTVDANGVLSLNVPVGKDAANQVVRVTIEPSPSDGGGAGDSHEAWRKFLAATAGTIDDPTFRRHDQGALEQENIFP